MSWTITRTGPEGRYFYQVRHKGRVMATRTTPAAADFALYCLQEEYGDNPPEASGKRGHYAYTLATGEKGVLYAAKTLKMARSDLRYMLGTPQRLPNGTRVFKLERE